MLPLPGFLRRVNRRSRMPIVALLVFGVIDVGVVIYGYIQGQRLRHPGGRYRDHPVHELPRAHR